MTVYIYSQDNPNKILFGTESYEQYVPKNTIKYKCNKVLLDNDIVTFTLLPSNEKINIEISNVVVDGIKLNKDNIHEKLDILFGSIGSGGGTSISVTEVTLNEYTKTIYIDDTFQLIANIIPANAANKNVTWSSSDPTIVSVDEFGLVTGLKEGNAKVKVNTVNSNKEANCEFIIKEHIIIDDRKTITVKLTSDKLDINTINVKFAPLKYNKRFAFSITSDDTRIDAWNRLFKYVQGGWIDKESNWHLNIERSEGKFAPRMLTYTDGCSNERMFPIGTANIYNIKNPNGFEPLEYPNPDLVYAYMTWPELLEILEFEGSANCHDVKTSTNNLENIKLGIDDSNNSFIKPKLNRSLITMTEPNGNALYITAAEENDNFKCITKQIDWANHNGKWAFRDMNDVANYDKLKIGRLIKDNYTLEQFKTEFLTYLINPSKNNVHKYGELGVHGLSDSKGAYPYNHENIEDSEKIKFLNWLYKTYGTIGEDSIWACTNDELIQYKILCRDSKLEVYSLKGNILTLKLDVPEIPNFYWSEFTILFEGCSLEDSGVTCKEAYGISNNINMLNINFDKELNEKSKKYLSTYLSSTKEEDKKKALYFINRLKPELKDSYLSQINTKKN